MKLLIIVLIFVFQVSGTIFTKRVTYIKNNVPLVQVFREIKKQTGYNIIWNEAQIDVTTIINANFKQSSLETVLNKCLLSIKLYYTIKNRTIIITRKYV